MDNIVKQIEVTISADIDRGGFGVTDSDQARTVMAQLWHPASFGKPEPTLDAGRFLVDFTAELGAQVLAGGVDATVTYEGRVYSVEVEPMP